MDEQKTENKSWYDTGDAAFDKEKQKRDNQVFQPDRFWMKEGTEAEIVFVPNSKGVATLFAINEHNPRKDGSFMNWITCVQGFHSSEPCCDVDSKGRYWVGYHTVIDFREWKSKKGGQVNQYELKLYPAKLETSQILKRRAGEQEKQGRSLAWACFGVARTGDKSAAVGNDFSYNRHITDMASMFNHVMYKGKKLKDIYAEAQNDPKKMERLKKTFDVVVDEEGKLLPVVPAFNYMELLKPKSVDEVRAHFRGFTPGGGFSSKSGSSSFKDEDGGSSNQTPDDDIPF